ncbi:hypothetical protein VKT23_018398 [Stygiomarasmius scandens]|uniref:Uncharacterized protein n=1 Tax=Marasmiellus scandens TaxID=2682957 RepID=A0ABR1IQP8_9AGAR
MADKCFLGHAVINWTLVKEENIEAHFANQRTPTPKDVAALYRSTNEGDNIHNMLVETAIKVAISEAHVKKEMLSQGATGPWPEYHVPENALIYIIDGNHRRMLISWHRLPSLKTLLNVLIKNRLKPGIDSIKQDEKIARTNEAIANAGKWLVKFYSLEQLKATGKQTQILYTLGKNEAFFQVPNDANIHINLIANALLNTLDGDGFASALQSYIANEKSGDTRDCLAHRRLFHVITRFHLLPAYVKMFLEKSNLVFSNKALSTMRLATSEIYYSFLEYGWNVILYLFHQGDHLGRPFHSSDAPLEPCVRNESQDFKKHLHTLRVQFQAQVHKRPYTDYFYLEFLTTEILDHFNAAYREHIQEPSLQDYLGVSSKQSSTVGTKLEHAIDAYWNDVFKRLEPLFTRRAEALSLKIDELARIQEDGSGPTPPDHLSKDALIKTRKFWLEFPRKLRVLRDHPLLNRGTFGVTAPYSLPLPCKALLADLKTAMTDQNFCRMLNEIFIWIDPHVILFTASKVGKNLPLCAGEAVKTLFTTVYKMSEEVASRVLHSLMGYIWSVRKTYLLAFSNHFELVLTTIKDASTSEPYWMDFLLSAASMFTATDPMFSNLDLSNAPLDFDDAFFKGWPTKRIKGNMWDKLKPHLTEPEIKALPSIILRTSYPWKTCNLATQNQNRIRFAAGILALFQLQDQMKSRLESMDSKSLFDFRDNISLIINRGTQDHLRFTFWDQWSPDSEGLELPPESSASSSQLNNDTVIAGTVEDEVCNTKDNAAKSVSAIITALSKEGVGMVPDKNGELVWLPKVVDAAQKLFEEISYVNAWHSRSLEPNESSSGADIIAVRDADAMETNKEVWGVSNDDFTLATRDDIKAAFTPRSIKDIAQQSLKPSANISALDREAERYSREERRLLRKKEQAHAKHKVKPTLKSHKTSQKAPVASNVTAKSVAAAINSASTSSTSTKRKASGPHSEQPPPKRPDQDSTSTSHGPSRAHTPPLPPPQTSTSSHVPTPGSQPMIPPSH